MRASLIGFIGGGNMASALIGGLLKSGHPPQNIVVLDPDAAQRERLETDLGVRTLAAADGSLTEADLLVWAVKPQLFKEAAAACRPFLGGTLHLSVMAGIGSDTLVRGVGSQRVVRAMPNTPAMIGQGISGLFARDVVTSEERLQVDAVMAPTGQTLWLSREDELDAVTALSGSGPAYVFYFIEAMIAAAESMGLSPAQGRQLALATFSGATALAQGSQDPPAVLREKVTSRGGTTHAALSLLAERGVGPAIVEAVQAAQRRAREMGVEFGS